jgi:hypothetical protein
MHDPSLKVTEQVKKLIDMGYYPFQVNGFIYDCVGTTKLDQLSATELETLRVELDNQIKFGLKCQTLKEKRINPYD